MQAQVQHHTQRAVNGQGRIKLDNKKPSYYKAMPSFLKTSAYAKYRHLSARTLYIDDRLLRPEFQALNCTFGSPVFL